MPWPWGVDATLGATVVSEQIAKRWHSSERSIRRARHRVEPRPVSEWLESDAVEVAGVHGRLHVLEATEFAGTACAAWSQRERLERASVSLRVGGAIRYRESMRLSTRACGRLLVVDESGAALIDDDAFVIAPAPALDGHALLREGDEVTVLGRARGDVADADALPYLRSAYRTAGRILRFDARENEPLVLSLTQPHGR